MAGWFADILVEYLFRVLVRGIQLLRSHSWPITKGTILGAACPEASYGCPVANIDYEYIIDGVKYADCYKKPFLVHASGVAYADLFVKGADFKVRLKPGDPSVSIAEPRGWSQV
jgi:hypothetical protein